MIKLLLELLVVFFVSGFVIALVNFVQVAISTVVIALGAGLHGMFSRAENDWVPPVWIVVPQLFIFQAFGISLIAKIAGLYFQWQWLYGIGSWAYLITLILSVVNILVLFITALIHGKYDLLGES